MTAPHPTQQLATAIFHAGKLVGGGVFVPPRHVLTARHVLTGPKPDGVWDHGKELEPHVIHEALNRRVEVNVAGELKPISEGPHHRRLHATSDIALLELATDLPTGVTPVFASDWGEQTRSILNGRPFIGPHPVHGELEGNIDCGSSSLGATKFPLMGVPADPGYSGTPLFVEYDGRWICFGIACLGGHVDYLLCLRAQEFADFATNHGCSPRSHSLAPTPAESTQPLSMESTIQSIATRYGKLGLLIDDAEDADLRLARELYGAEVLPHWWLTARTEDCGKRAFAAFRKELTGLRRDPAAGIVIIDRYLPPDHDNSRPEAITVGKGFLDETNQLALNNALEAERPPFHAKLLTSFPQNEPTGIGNIRWATRRLAEIETLRKRLVDAPPNAHDLPRSLLAYGPHPDHDESWSEALDSVSEALSEDTSEHAILVTGPGCAVRYGRYGNGIPQSRAFCIEAHCIAKSLAPGLSEREARPCCCKRQPHSPLSELHPDKHADPIADGARRLASAKEFLSTSSDQLSNYEWALDELLSSRGPNSTALRRALQKTIVRYDIGFPYHYWLLAQMRWRTILTTNSDRFHERAAWTFAEGRSGAVDKALQYSIAAPIDWDSDVSQQFQTQQSFVKPYADIADLATDLQSSEASRFQQALLAIAAQLPRESHLVILGHPLGEPLLGGDPGVEPLAEIIESKKLFVTWVGPEVRKDSDSAWARSMQQLESNKRGWRLQATALEYVYDLFSRLPHTQR